MTFESLKKPLKEHLSLITHDYLILKWAEEHDTADRVAEEKRGVRNKELAKQLYLASVFGGNNGWVRVEAVRAALHGKIEDEWIDEASAKASDRDTKKRTYQ